jgi:16S rRNA (guanine(966)-N(2))-methyltransferase RsmD
LSILAHRTQGARVLDLYAGTGALGLESLSRGAHQVVFVENHVTSARILRENVTRCGHDERCVVIIQDVETFLTAPPSFGEPPAFDIVFVDPPYHTTDLTRLLERLSLSGKIASQGMVILEHFFKHPVPSRIGALTQTRQSRYGDTMLTFYQRSAEETCD